MPPTALKCIESWHRFMPDYEYVLWNEDNFDVNASCYTKEAYDSGKYAFVSDVARLMALKEFGGIYFDVDFEVFKPFDDLLSYKAFAGFEGSKYNPVMMGVIASICFTLNPYLMQERRESGRTVFLLIAAVQGIRNGSAITARGPLVAGRGGGGEPLTLRCRSFATASRTATRRRMCCSTSTSPKCLN